MGVFDDEVTEPYVPRVDMMREQAKYVFPRQTEVLTEVQIEFGTEVRTGCYCGCCDNYSCALESRLQVIMYPYIFREGPIDNDGTKSLTKTLYRDTLILTRLFPINHEFLP